jgi:hypothetical protein
VMIRCCDSGLAERAPRTTLGRFAALDDVRFATHYGLNSNIELGPKTCTTCDIEDAFRAKKKPHEGGLSIQTC